MFNQKDIKKLVAKYEEQKELFKVKFEESGEIFTEEVAAIFNRIERIVSILEDEGLTECIDY